MKKITKAYEEAKLKEVGAALKALRRSRKLTQEKMGAIIGLHQSALSRVEDGQQELTIAQMHWICRELGIDSFL